MEEPYGNRKLKTLWLKRGHENAKFIHRVVNAHKRINLISKVRVNGVWL